MTQILSARVAGPSGADTLILLHSIATSSAMWEPQIAVLAERFRVLVVDLPGHGASPALPEGADFGDFADAVVRGARERGIERASIAGLSLGSMVAQRMAACHPSFIESLVLANGVAHASTTVGELWKGRIAAARKEGMASQVEASLSRWFTPQFRQEAPLTVARIGRLVAAADTEGYVSAAAAIASLDHRDLLPLIACPTLVIAGERDQAAPLAEVRNIAEAVPGARFAALLGAHLANVECATEFTECLGGFLLNPLGK